MKAKKAFLIDGTAFCYRAYYAISVLSTADGRPTNAVYGVAMMLKALRDKEKPDYLAFAFDVGKPTFRHKVFEEYKSQRKPMPDPLIEQMPMVKSLLAAFRIPVFEREGFEGEDVLATIAKRIVKEGVQVYLVTGDKDVLQLVNSHICVYNPNKQNEIIDADAVYARYGVSPDQMVDLLALMGDKIDNIPGVPGVGEKTAANLLQEFGTLDKLYLGLDQLKKEKLRKNLESSRKQVLMARELARIDANVAIDVTLEALEPQETDWKKLRALYREFDFKRLIKDLDERELVPSQSKPIKSHVLTNIPVKDAEALFNRLSKTVTALGCWSLTNKEKSTQAIILSISDDKTQAWMAVLDVEFLNSTTGKQLVQWLSDLSSKKLAHDAKIAARLLRTLNIGLQGVEGDTMIVGHLLNPARTQQSLSDLSDEYLDEPLGKMPKLQVDSWSIEENGDKFARSVCSIKRLHELLLGKLKKQKIERLYTELELPLMEVLNRMEAIGIKIDVAYLNKLHVSMESKLNELTKIIYELSGETFNLNSPKQLSVILFQKLNLPIIKRTKTGASTDSGVLHQLAEKHPLPKHLIEYREISKLMSTYVDALPKLVDAKTRRIHTTFNQTATTTGRLSSSEPNIQNIPIKTELGRSIRKAFVPGIANSVLLAADYSQIELRILAHLSQDPQLTQAFQENRDIHRYTASLIYDVPEDQVTQQQRSEMKAINFGIIYGMSSHGLSKELGISFQEAQEFIDAYFERYPSVRGYLDSQIAMAKRKGYVETMLGRRRYIPEVSSNDLMVRQFGERMAINAPIQGTAADLIKKAMIELHSKLLNQQFKSKLLLQVHDELVFEVPTNELDDLVSLARETMEGAIELNVPLTVTMKSGPNWLELKAVE